MEAKTKSPYRDKKTEEIIRELAAKFFLEESNSTSLITVTNVLLAGNFKNVKVFFTVFPNDKEKEALDFAKRRRSDFKDYIKSNSRIGRIPQVDFDIDFGEKNRQLIDEISNRPQ